MGPSPKTGCLLIALGGDRHCRYGYQKHASCCLVDQWYVSPAVAYWAAMLEACMFSAAATTSNRV